MIVVSNSSPLVSLCAIGRLELLRNLYGTISIPRAVHYEVAVQGSGRPGAAEVQTFDWITSRDVGNPNLATALQGKLDHGEAEAIALALELQADLLLMDERLGRIESARSSSTDQACYGRAEGQRGFPFEFQTIALFARITDTTGLLATPVASATWAVNAVVPIPRLILN